MVGEGDFDDLPEFANEHNQEVHAERSGTSAATAARKWRAAVAVGDDTVIAVPDSAQDVLKIQVSTGALTALPLPESPARKRRRRRPWALPWPPSPLWSGPWGDQGWR